MKVLILGGYGTFGGRLAQLLAEEPRVSLIIAGRSLGKAQALCGVLGAGTAAMLDRDSPLEAPLRELAPDIVVDASGPWQDYGEGAYRVAEAALAAGASYLDLADGAQFVQGVGRLDALAKDKSLFVLAGASSYPALSAAAVRALAKGLDWLHTIVGGIAPSPHAGVGLNVVRAIAGYAGRPVKLRVAGGVRTSYAWTDTLRFTIAPPGAAPLVNRGFSLVDVPDLALLPPLWPQVRTVWMGAGPSPDILRWALTVLARGVRARLLPGLAPAAPLLHWASRTFRWGEHRGGMFIRLTGYIKNKPVERSWHLIVEGDDGPYVPAMAAAALIGRVLSGKPPAPGARPCLAELELEDFEAQFARKAIVTGRRETRATEGNLPLFRRVLGEAWDGLPPAVQAMHAGVGLTLVQGRGSVTRGRGPLAWLAATMMGFPRAGDDIPVRVAILPDGGAETWRREFAGKRFSSVLREGRGRSQWLLVERFGIVRVGLAVLVADGRLNLLIRRWSLLGVPLPLWLGPRTEAFESEAEGRFHFDVAMSHPLAGLIVHYRGWLEPAARP